MTTLIDERVVEIHTDAPLGTVVDGDIATGLWDVQWDDGTSGTYEGPQLQLVDEDEEDDEDLDDEYDF